MTRTDLVHRTTIGCTSSKTILVSSLECGLIAGSLFENTVYAKNGKLMQILEGKEILEPLRKEDKKYLLIKHKFQGDSFLPCQSVLRFWAKRFFSKN